MECEQNVTIANSHDCATIYFQVPFSLPSPSSLLKLPVVNRTTAAKFCGVTLSRYRHAHEGINGRFRTRSRINFNGILIVSKGLYF